ncbi:MAG: hypothetical protein LUF30_12785, partial [Lachnospiraceae bacterium]|nr:hypothetical protein [Lachnospiraceae bacterium]
MRMSELSLKSKILFVFTCLFCAAYGVNGTFAYYWLSAGLDAAIAGDGGLFARYCGYSLLLAFLSYALILLAMVMLSFYSADGALTAKDAIIRNILKRPMAQFRKRDNAYWMNLFTTDIDMYHNDYLSMTPFVAHSAMMFLSALFLLMLISALIAGTSLLFSLLPFASSQFFSGLTRKR